MFAIVRTPSRLTRLLLPALLAACGGVEADDTGADSSSGAAEDPEPHVTFTGKVDAIELCGVEGASVVTFVARQVGCEAGPPAPCTIKVDPYREWSGDAVTCPSSQTSLDMRVSVPTAGRFQIEAKTTTASGFLSLCFGEKAAVPTLATRDQLEARAEIFVEQTNKVCPTPR